MAIPFLNHLDLRSVSELRNALLHLTTEASATDVEGKIIYDTGTNSLKYYNGSVWVNLDGSGDISSVTAGAGLTGGGSDGAVTLNVGQGNGIVVAADTVSHADTSSVSDLSPSSRTYITGLTFDTYGHVQTISTGTETVVDTDRYVNSASFNTGTGVLTLTRAGSDTATVTVDLDGRYQPAGSYDNYVSWTIQDGDTTSYPITSGDTLQIASGTEIISNFTADDVLTISHANVTRSNTSDSSSPTSGGNISVIDSITTNARGHVTAVNTKTITLPVDADVDVSVSNLVTRLGQITGNATIGGASSTITVPGDLVVTGTVTTNNVETVSTSNGVIFEGNAADANEGTLLAGTLTADRTYTLPNATGTIALTSDLPTVSNATITLSAGNSGITMDVDNQFTLNQSGSETITISHADTSSQASVNNSGLTVIQDVTVDTYGHVTGLGSANLTSGIDGRISAAQYATTITDTATVTHSLGTRDVVVQLYDVTTYETVYADVVRTSTAAVDITFVSTPSNSIRVLVQKIG